MDPPVDVTKLSSPATRILDPKSPAPIRQMGAKGIAPGLKPADALTVIAVLAESEDTSLASLARATLDKLPVQLLTAGLTPDLHPGVVGVIAPRYASDVTIMERVLSLPQIAMATIAEVAAKASEAVAELIATNEERLLKYPAIIEKLYLNRATRMSTADRMIELAVRNKIELTGIPAFKEAAAAIAEELIPEPTAEPNFDDEQFIQTEKIAQSIQIDPTQEDTHVFDPETGEEVAVEKVRPLYAQLAELSVSKKIRRAQVGNSAERMILVRDADRRVAVAAIKSPSIQEAEVVRISAGRSASEDVLRVIALNREWTRHHQIKLNLVSNPRCPFAFAAKLVPHLRDHELKSLARSKNVTGAIATAARQQLERKGQKAGQ
jgi:hypothetical protein